MKSLIILMFMVFGIQQAQAEILCVDPDPSAGKLCLGKQVKNPTEKQQAFITQMSKAVDRYGKKNCLKKDGSCVSSLWVEYCDTDLLVCNVLGEIKYDTGTFNIYRTIYEVKENGWISILEMKKTGEMGYPN